jgi:soluble lytic murein transglycosylase-like protein
MGLARTRTIAGAAVLATVLGLARAAFAEVIEIGADGSTVRLSAPAVYTTEGVRPIAPVRAAPVAAGAAQAELARVIRQAAERQGVNPDLLGAVAWRESGLRPNALSPKGAFGVMQLMPATANALGVDRYDLRQNIEGGAAYLRQMLDRYAGNVTLGLAAYNAGPGAVDRYGGVPPFAETKAYVGAILTRISARPAAVAAPLPLIEP